MSYPSLFKIKRDRIKPVVVYVDINNPKEYYVDYD